MSGITGCRLCLACDIQMYDISNTQLQDVYERLTGIPLSVKDISPDGFQKACYLCVAKLKKCLALKEQSIKANEALSKLLSADVELTQQELRSVNRESFNLIPNLHISVIKEDQFHKYTENVEENRTPEFVYEVELISDYDNIKIKKEVMDDGECKYNYIPTQCKVELQEEDSDILDQINDNKSSIHIKIKNETDMVNNFAAANISTAHHNLHKSGARMKDKSKIKQMSKPKNLTTGQNTFDGNNIEISQSSEYERLFPFPCNKCEFRTVTEASLLRHKKLHDMNRQFVCDYCKYRFGRKQLLNAHIQQIHLGKAYSSIKETKLINSKDLKDATFFCPTCPYKTLRKAHLRIHLRTHTGEKPYSCSLCQYKCSQKGYLRTHLRTHTGERPYICTLCNYKSSVKSHLKRHLRTHSTDKPSPDTFEFICTMCEYRSFWKHNLLRHLKKHTEEKPE